MFLYYRQCTLLSMPKCMKSVLLLLFLQLLLENIPCFSKKNWMLLHLPEPMEPGVKPWPKAHRNAARSGALHTARFWLLVGCEAFAVGMWEGASFTGGLPSAAAFP